MMAALLGAGPVADAFLAAFQIINVARRLLSEGALNAALVPAYWHVHDRSGATAATAFAGRVLGTVSLALFVVAALLGLVMPTAIGVLAPGFAGTPTLQMAVDNARLMLPYLAFAGPVTVMMGLLNAHHRFALAAFSPLLFNIALIAAMAVLLVRPQDTTQAALAIAATVGIAGLLQLAMLATRGGSLAAPLRIGFDREMRGFLGKALPAMIANASPQLLIVAAAIVASASPAAVSWLYFANRLIELPLGIVGGAMGMVLVPELTRAARSDDGTFTQGASRSIELALGLALPAMLGLAILSEPIVRLLFEHGAFTADDAHATAVALLWLTLGLPAQVLTKALAPAFFARHDTASPLSATLAGLAVALIAAMLLGARFGVAGIAAAIALAAWTGALVLLWHGRARHGFTIDADARKRLPRIALAALAMGALLWLLTGALSAQFAAANHLVLATTLALAIAASLATYGGLLALLGVVRPRDLRIP
jgi:putative peptidoglycan lipid II flippase